MIGLALIVVSLLLYKAYKAKLKHDKELEHLSRENAMLRAELDSLRKEYEQVMMRRQAGMNWEVSEEALSDSEKLERLAEAIRRKESLF